MLVITLAQIDSYLIFLILTAGVTGLEHMAFRTGKWRRRELIRRAIGIETVLVLFLLVVWLGDADVWTWAMLQGGFLVAGAIKATAAYVDRLHMEQFQAMVIHESDAETDS